MAQIRLNNRDPRDVKRTAKEFAESWSTRDGYEKGETAQFWCDLLFRVLDISNPYEIIRFESRADNGGYVDCSIRESLTFIEQKSSGVDLDKPELRQGVLKTPLEQVCDYADSLKRPDQPRFLITCNFKTFRIYDRDLHGRNELATNYIEFSLEELGNNPGLLGFIIDPANSRTEKEKAASIKAGELIGKLYDKFISTYNITAAEDLHALNVLCVRLVFCLFCEDAGLFKKDAFHDYLKDTPPSNMGLALKHLFTAFNTPRESRKAFDTTTRWAPYVNGGLFTEEVEIPPFTDELRLMLLTELSLGTDWSAISPTIFGGIFESTLNPETRRQGGMHYTSPENIHKLIDPLFLNDLTDELQAICDDPVPNTKITQLKKYHDKISTLNFLDPACGSGNFLTETYRCLRELENKCLSEISAANRKMSAGQMTMIFDVTDPGKHVSLNQFHGIEINDFACRVARTALWIAKLQADEEGLAQELESPFPLHEVANIKCENALQVEWNDVLPIKECNYIIGNPPFYGSSFCSASQKKEIVDLYGNIKMSNSLDYVAGWYYKACQMLEENDSIRCAFVSTNSICQGEQVAPIWGTLKSRFGIEMNFAHKTFIWDSEATDKAHVHVIIVGFSRSKRQNATIYDESGGRVVSCINPYLKEAPFAVVESRSQPICNVPKLTKGNQPTDAGNFILSEEEAAELLKTYPEIECCVRRYIGGRDLLNDNEIRYCLWLKDIDKAIYQNCTPIQQRIKAVKEFRQQSTAEPTRKSAERPHLFFSSPQTDETYIIIPRVSSERRDYIPLAFKNPSEIASDSCSIICGASLYHFGVLQSQFHNAWMRVVCGRLKSDYRYSGSVVYNNFIWPEPTEAQKTEIERLAQEVLDARGAHPGKSLAELYDPEKMPADLQAVHKALDASVEAAYSVDFQGDEERIVAHLFKLYAEAIGNEK